jgi:uncharacterized protein (TIGR02147 family)
VRPEPKKQPKVQDYLDYRAFLNDFYEWKRVADPEFTQRVFAREIGLPASGSSMLPAILKGKRNLSQSLRVKFARALSLPERSSRYFDLLVQFNQAKGMEEKNHFFSQLSRFHASKAHVLQESQFEYFSRWHYSAVRTYFLMETRERDPSRIAAKLFPEVSAEKVAEAIKVLLELGLIKKTVNGYTVTEKHLTTPPDVRAEAARKHVHELSRLSLEVLDRAPPDLRQFNTLMFSVSPQGFTALKDRARSFLEEVREILDRDQGEDRIYTLNLQLFPNSRLAGLKPAPAKAKG